MGEREKIIPISAKYGNPHNYNLCNKLCSNVSRCKSYPKVQVVFWGEKMDTGRKEIFLQSLRTASRQQSEPQGETAPAAEILPCH